MHEAGQRFGVQLAGEHAASSAAARLLGARGGLVENRNDLQRTVRERRDHGGRGEEHVDDDDHLAGHAHAVELFLAREDVHLMIEFDLGQH